MASLNKVQLIGNLGKDPRIATLTSGARVASFSLATSESWKDKQTGEKKEATEWHNIVVYNDNLVPIVERYLKKGSKCYIEGQLRTRKYQDQSGADRYTTEVVLRVFNGQLILLGDAHGGPPAIEDNVRPTSSFRAAPRSAADADLDDDIPF